MNQAYKENNIYVINAKDLCDSQMCLPKNIYKWLNIMQWKMT